jgi:outer membrane lipoprotein carrier protein
MTAPAILAAFLQTVAPAPPSAPAEALARRIEEHHGRVAGLTARFVQTYRSAVLGREVVERGVVSIKRPGRMRWEYRDPEPKTFVSDGSTFYFYVPADRQVIVRDQDDERSIPVVLLSGRGDLLGQFLPSLETAPPGRRRLRLIPRKPEPEVESVLVEVDGTYGIRSIEIEDAQGNLSRFRFDDVRSDVSLPDRLFRFEVPRGVEVVAG